MVTDEVFIRIKGEQHYLWRAVVQDGVVLDILAQPRRDGGAAKCFFRRRLMGLPYVPRMIVTDKTHGSLSRTKGRVQAVWLSKFLRPARLILSRVFRTVAVPLGSFRRSRDGCIEQKTRR